MKKSFDEVVKIENTLHGSYINSEQGAFIEMRAESFDPNEHDRDWFQFYVDKQKWREFQKRVGVDDIEESVDFKTCMIEVAPERYVCEFEYGETLLYRVKDLNFTEALRVLQDFHEPAGILLN